MALRNVILKLSPASTAEAMEAESREWVMTCERCGHDQSIWDAGGIRYKAAGEPVRRARCAGCGEKCAHRVHRISSAEK